MSAGFLAGSFDGGFQIADIIQCIKNTDDVDAVGNRFLHKIFHQIVRIMAVTQHILSSEEHLELGFGHVFAQNTQTIPRIFIQKAQAGVKSGAAPAFQ